MNLNSLSDASYRIGRLILVAATAVLLVLALLALLRIGVTYWLYATLEDWVTVRLGFDYYAAQLATTIVVSILTALLPTLAWYVLLGKKKVWGTAAMIGGQALICLLVYALSGQVCFDRRTGAPLCYFTDTTSGRVWSYTPGYDPKSGRPFKLYTREVQEREESERQKQGEDSGGRQLEEQRLREAASRQQQFEQHREDQLAKQREEREVRNQELIARQQQLDAQHQEVEAQRRRDREQLTPEEEEEGKQEKLERQRQKAETRGLQVEQQKHEELARVQGEQEELRRQEEQERKERDAEQCRLEVEERGQREEEQRRNDARNRLIVDLINKGIQRIPVRKY